MDPIEEGSDRSEEEGAASLETGDVAEVEESDDRPSNMKENEEEGDDDDTSDPRQSPKDPADDAKPEETTSENEGAGSGASDGEQTGAASAEKGAEDKSKERPRRRRRERNRSPPAPQKPVQQQQRQGPAWWSKTVNIFQAAVAGATAAARSNPGENQPMPEGCAGTLISCVHYCVISVFTCTSLMSRRWCLLISLVSR